MECNNFIPSKIYHISSDLADYSFNSKFSTNMLYHIIYIKKGAAHVVIDNCIHFINAGQFIILDGSMETTLKSDEQIDIINVVFSLNNKANENILNKIIFSNSVTEPYINSIIYEYKTKHINYQQVILYNIASLLIYCSRIKDNNDTMHIGKDNFEMKVHTLNIQQKIVDDCIILINNNLNNPDLNVTFLTNNLYISPAYLHKLFNKYMHTSINKYIQGLRLTRASELLKDSIIPITEISEMLGYCSQCYFSTQFKKKMNVTPSEFRVNYGLRVTL